MKQIDTSQVLEGLINRKEGGNISAAARKLNISPQRLGQYVRGNRNPNIEFIKKWKEVYGDDLLNYRETPTETTVSIPLGQFYVSPEEHIEAIREQKRMADQRAEEAREYAKDLKDIIIAQLTKIDTNLGAALAGVYHQSIKVEAASTTVLKSLARLEHKKQDALVLESNKIEREIADSNARQGRSFAENR